ncbi:MAG: phosphocholine cytidylyltransferase family protein [Archaeoglobaceae archaeon]
MKAVILAAGYGGRLGELTKEVPKAMLEIGGKPIIYYHLKVLHGRVESIVVVTGHKAEVLRSYLVENFPDFNFEFVHNGLYRVTNNIYSLYLALKVVNDGFYLLNSDVFFHPEIFDRLAISSKGGVTLSVDTTKKLGREEMKVIIEGDRIIRISKEIDPEVASGEYIGIMRVPGDQVEDLKDHTNMVMEKFGARVFYEEAVQSMINYGASVYFETTSGLPWIEIDTPEELEIARREIYPKIYDALPG